MTNGFALRTPLVGSLVTLGAGVVPVAPIQTLGVLGLLLLLAWRTPQGRTQRWFSTVMLLGLFGVSSHRAATAIADYAARWENTRRDFGAPARCALTATVVSSPQRIGDALRFTARLDELDCEGRKVSVEGLVRLYGGPDTLGRGDRFEGVAQLGVQRLFRNLELPNPFVTRARSNVVLSGGLLSCAVLERGSGLTRAVDRLRTHTRRRVESTFAPLVQGMAKALILGENDLTAEEHDAFQSSGLAHLLAVSGTHLVFAVVSITAGLTALLVRFPPISERLWVARWTAPVGAVLACAYADFAGGSGSAWRAAWMLTAAYLLRALGREPSGGQVLGISVGVGVLVDPLAAFDLSFMLSVAATAGLMTLGRWAGRPVERLRSRAARTLSTGLVATVSSLIPCSVLLSMISPKLSLAGIVANVLVAPFGESIALPLCLLHVVVGFAPALEAGLAVAASGALAVVREAALRTGTISDEVPLLALSIPPFGANHFALLVCGVLLAVWLVNKKAKLGLGVVVGFCLAVLERDRTSRPLGELTVTVLDVGQGDSSLVDFPDGRSMLLDAGGFVGSPVDPGAQVVLPLLRRRGQRYLDVVVLSHPHPDHFLGLLSVARTQSIGEFWDTGQGTAEGAGPAYQQLMQTLTDRGVPILGPQELCGERAYGGAIVEVLGPCPSFVPGRDANDNSWVLRIRYGNRAVLFTGDAEREQEQELLETHATELKADLLKVGHHGSRTSSQLPFLEAVSPAFATISCGVRNRYGHPHEQTVRNLQRAGVQALRLDETGAVVWRTDGQGVQLNTFRDPDFTGTLAER